MEERNTPNAPSLETLQHQSPQQGAEHLQVSMPPSMLDSSSSEWAQNVSVDVVCPPFKVCYHARILLWVFVVVLNATLTASPESSAVAKWELPSHCLEHALKALEDAFKAASYFSNDAPRDMSATPSLELNVCDTVSHAHKQALSLELARCHLKDIRCPLFDAIAIDCNKDGSIKSATNVTTCMQHLDGDWGHTTYMHCLTHINHMCQRYTVKKRMEIEFFAHQEEQTHAQQIIDSDREEKENEAKDIVTRLMAKWMAERGIVFSDERTSFQWLRSLTFFLMLMVSLSIFIRNKLRTFMYVVACVEFLLEAGMHTLVSKAILTDVGQEQFVSFFRCMAGALGCVACFVGLILSFVPSRNEGDAFIEKLKLEVERQMEELAIAPLVKQMKQMKQMKELKSLLVQNGDQIQSGQQARPREAESQAVQPSHQNASLTIAPTKAVRSNPNDQNPEQEGRNGSHHSARNPTSESEARGRSDSNADSSVKPKDTEAKPNNKRKNDDDAKASSPSKRKTPSKYVDKQNGVDAKNKKRKPNAVDPERKKRKTRSHQGPSPQKDRSTDPL